MLTIGIDVAKATLEVAAWQDGQGERIGVFPNHPAGWDALRTAVTACLASPAAERGTAERGTAEAANAAANAAVAVVLEPTGGYELGVALWARQQPGWQVHRPNPAQVRAWATSQGIRAKTDRQDARLLARYGAAHAPLPVWQPLASEVSELEQLLHRRDEVAAWVRREQARADQLAARPDASPTVRASRSRLLRTLEEELAELEAAIAEHLRAHAELHAHQTRLQTVCGVGPRVGPSLVVACERFQTRLGRPGTLADAKRLVAYLGVDPKPYQSGTSVHGPSLISRQGDGALRARLYMGALGALHGPNPLHAFYDGLVARGKPKKVALVAAMRKLVVWAWAVFVTGQDFDPSKCAHNTA